MQLIFFVEGYRDELLIKYVAEHVFEVNVKIIIKKYANEKIDKIDKYLKFLNKNSYRYFLLADFDSNSHPCITNRKSSLSKKFKNLDPKYVIIVKEEIESWYLAGTVNVLKKKKNIKYKGIEKISKEVFYKNFKPNNMTEIEFLTSLLQKFSIEEAKKQSVTFNYLIDRINKIKNLE